MIMMALTLSTTEQLLSIVEVVCFFPPLYLPIYMLDLVATEYTVMSFYTVESRG
jgi:hypothetical protein